MTEVSLYLFSNWLIAGVILLAALEGLVQTYVFARPFDWKASAVSLFTVVGKILIEFSLVFMALPGVYWLYQNRIFNFSIQDPVGLLVLFVAVDFAYYWLHRWSHSTRWLWLTHAAHHSPNELNFSATLRLGWLANFTFGTVVYSPIALLGFSPFVISSAVVIMLVSQFWIHNTWIPSLGPLEYILNTPAAHRVHHARNPEYLNCNYGGLLIIFDRIFGTYRAEKAEIEIEYGWSKPLHTYNPLVCLFQPAKELYDDLKVTSGAINKLKLIFVPTPFLGGVRSKKSKDRIAS